MNHDVPAYGLWSLVIINAAVFILFAFSFFKPKTAKDWRTVRSGVGCVRRPDTGVHSETPASSAGGSAACVVVEVTMDTSVALVQAYLHVNGYFTVAEYPVLEAYRGDHARTVTDLDILAFRFAGASHDVIRGRGRRRLGERAFATDSILRCPSDRPDMIVGEVKEGAARFNAAMRDPVVLEVALTRFGCCLPEHVRELTQQLLSRGNAVTPGGHSVRMVAFGDVPKDDPPTTWTTVPMRHVVQFLQTYLREHWDVLRHAQIRDPAFGVLALIEKWGVDAQGSPEPGTQQWKRGRVRGGILRGKDVRPRRTV